MIDAQLGIDHSIDHSSVLRTELLDPAALKLGMIPFKLQGPAAFIRSCMTS